MLDCQYQPLASLLEKGNSGLPAFLFPCFSLTAESSRQRRVFQRGGDSCAVFSWVYVHASTSFATPEPRRACELPLAMPILTVVTAPVAAAQQLL